MGLCVENLTSAPSYKTHELHAEIISIYFAVVAYAEMATGWKNGHYFRSGMIFLFTTPSIPALEHIWPPITCVPCIFPAEVKRSEREANRLSISGS